MMDEGELKVSNDLLGQSREMQSRLAAEGYLYFQQVLNTELIADLHASVLDIFARKGWLEPGEGQRAGRIPTVEGEEDFFEVYDEVQKLENLHGLAHHPELTEIMRAAVGPTAFPHPLCIARLVFPDNEECTTPPHQDFPNNQGTEALYASWIPLADCPRELGGLSILESSSSLGLLPLEFSLGAGGRQASLPEQAQELRWLSADFRRGDVLIFGSMTVHRSLPNHSDNQFRLSVDFRFQEEGQALTEGVLEPHFGRLSWEEIYNDWQSDALHYYWHHKKFEVVPWDDSMHALPEGHMKEAIRLSREYKQRRERSAANKKG